MYMPIRSILSTSHFSPSLDLVLRLSQRGPLPRNLLVQRGLQAVCMEPVKRQWQHMHALL